MGCVSALACEKSSDATNKTRPAPGDTRLHATLLLTEARKLFLVSCPSTSSLITQVATNHLQQYTSSKNCQKNENKNKKFHSRFRICHHHKRVWRPGKLGKAREELEMAEPSKIEAPSSRFPFFCSAAPSYFDI